LCFMITQCAPDLLSNVSQALSGDFVAHPALGIPGLG
jgi:hypothetical protein